ncbi:MAG: extracellular solute-binding protein [Polyangiaceae bacterium]
MSESAAVPPARPSLASRSGWYVLAVALLAVIAFRPVTEAFKPAPPGVKVILWHSQRGDEQRVLEQLLRQFNRHPKNQGRVYVEPLGVPDASFKDKLIRNVPRGSGPDLFLRPHNELGELHGERVVAPLSKNELPFPEGAYLPKLLSGLSVDGELLGIPITYKGLFLFYNTTLAPRGPLRDTRELSELRRRLPQDVFPLVYDTTSLYFHSPFLLGARGRVFADDGRSFALFDEPGVASFRWPGTWKRAGILPPEPNYNEMVRLFQAGKASAIVCGPWYRPAGMVGAQGDWDVAPLPDVDGRPSGSFITVDGLYLSKESKHPAEAKEVMRFIAGADGERARLAELGLPPVVTASYDDLAQTASADADTHRRFEMVRVQRLALERGMVTPNSVRMAATWTPALDLLQASVAGRDFERALGDARYELARVDRVRKTPSDPRIYGAVLTALLILGTWRLAVHVRRGPSAEVARARLIGFSTRTAMPYLLPGMVAVVLLVAAPLLVGAGMSLFEYEHGSFTFAGLENFRQILLPPAARLFQARSFYFALAVTVLWTVCNVVLHVAIGVLAALALRPAWNRMRTAYRLLLILPWAIPNYITALMWKGMFNAQVGAVNALLSPFGFEGKNWFDSFASAFTANLVTNTWLGFPFMMVVTLGALQSIPGEVEEAAVLDGASRWQRFWLVVFPHLRPALIPSVILGSVWTFNMFNIIYLVSGGEPGSQTDILISEAYRWAFERGHRFGYAAAYSVLIFSFLLLYSRATERLQKLGAT